MKEFSFKCEGTCTDNEGVTVHFNEKDIISITWVDEA